VIMPERKYIKPLLITLLFLCSLYIFLTCGSEYPCTISGCGCSDVWEMLRDTWSDWQFMAAVICYFAYLLSKL